MWSAPTRRRYGLCLAQFLDAGTVGAHAAVCRAAAIDLSYVLELHCRHPGHQGCEWAVWPDGWGWYHLQLSAWWTGACRRRVALLVACCLDPRTAGAYAAVCRVSSWDHVFILAQYAEHPGHRGGGVLAPRVHDLVPVAGAAVVEAAQAVCHCGTCVGFGCRRPCRGCCQYAAWTWAGGRLGCGRGQRAADTVCLSRCCGWWF